MRRGLLISAVLLLAAFIVIGSSYGEDGARNRVRKAPSIERLPTAIASASSCGENAWMVLDSINSNKTETIEGSIRLSLLDAANEDTPKSRDRARVIAKFTTTPDGDTYTVRFVKVSAEAEAYAHFGGVVTRHSVFGDSGIAYKTLPRVQAVMAVWGVAEIFKGDESLANNLDAMVFVVPGIRNADMGNLLTANQVDFDRSEIHLILPGSLENKKAVPDMPGGFLYLVWPNAAIELRNIGGRVIAPTSAPTSTATGMYGGATPGEEIPVMEEEEGIVEIEAPTAETKPQEPEVKVKGMVQRIGPQPLNVMLMEDEVVADPLSLVQGNAAISMVNIASRPLGLMITGSDINGRKFTRYTAVINPGERRTFRVFAGIGPFKLTSYRHVKGPRGQYMQLSGTTTLQVQ